MMRPTAAHALLAVLGAVVLATAGVGIYRLRALEAAPGQPIAFPHTVHAGQLSLPCEFCHAYAGRSRHAGVPPLARCMECHQAIATDREEIRKLARHYEEKEPIRWNRVYAVPDFIYFSHERHVKAGVTCAECHGNVREMTKIRRVSSLKMGWCVSCHRVRGAPRDCTTCHK